MVLKTKLVYLVNEYNATSLHGTNKYSLPEKLWIATILPFLTFGQYNTIWPSQAHPLKNHLSLSTAIGFDIKVTQSCFLIVLLPINLCSHNITVASENASFLL